MRCFFVGLACFHLTYIYLTNPDTANAIPIALTSGNKISHGISDSFAMDVEENQECAFLGIEEVNDSDEMDNVGRGKNAPGLDRKGMKIPHHYFVRISPVALDLSDIQPSFSKHDNFQLVAWKSPEGRIKAIVTCDDDMQFVDPAKDGAYIIQGLNHYMGMHGKGLFLYIRAPDNDLHLGEIGDHLIEMCGLLGEFQECFEGMDVGWLPPA